MRFESVEAYAFGPFRDASLALVPGLNVVFGPNEAGKSTWHAALYAGLCGIRRAKGRAVRADARFEQRHRPWDANGAWEVGVRLALADGRRVALRHDLAGGVDSSARDAELAGRDYSNEIVFEGAPDGSRWLGLDRRSFLHTACVRQAQMLAVREDAGALQGALQAAAATAGADATAARALATLKGFRSEHVGSQRARTRPFVQSRHEVEAARGELDGARGARDGYQRKRAQLTAREELLRATRARLLAVRAHESGERLARIRALSRRFESGQPRLFDDPELADRVAGAVATWEAHPVPESPAGEDVEELEGRLADVEAELDTVAERVRGMRAWLSGAGGIGIVAGLATGAGYSVMLGWPVAVLGLGMLAWAFVWKGAGRRQPLEARRARIVAELPRRRKEEEELARAQRRLEEAESALRRVAADAGLDGGPPAALVDGLCDWQARRHRRLRRFEEEQSAWSELRRLLEDRTLEEWTAATEGLQAEAAAHGDVSGAADPGDTAESLERLERQQREALERELGALEERERNLPDVADAEERLAQAERRQGEIARLDATLRTTIDFLAAAELRVHRDVAQVLRETVLEWLPGVTGGRYVDCRVDPASLAVEVRGPDGHFRSADLLSHGTAEQVYLLLRLALARHLTKPREACPLLLDDALSGCDATRAVAVLDTLLAIAGETQVILFTHDADVRRWAEGHLREPRDRLIDLEPPGAR